MQNVNETNQIMEILDKNKENISDNDYLMMCNLLKDIHSKMPQDEKSHSLVKVAINPKIIDIIREYAEGTVMASALDFIEEHIVIIEPDDDDNEDFDPHGEIIDMLMFMIYSRLPEEVFKKMIIACGGEKVCRKMARNTLSTAKYNKLIRNKDKKYYESLALHGICGLPVTFACKCNDILTEEEKAHCISYGDFMGNMEEIDRDWCKEQHELAAEAEED